MINYKDRSRRKAFIGAAITAGAGLAKGIVGGIKARKQRKAAEQQSYLDAMLASMQSSDAALIANEGLAEQFEDKYVARFGGRKRCGCGGRRKANYGTLAAPSIAIQPKQIDINGINTEMQSMARNNIAQASFNTGSALGGIGGMVAGKAGNILGGLAGKLIAGGPAKKTEANISMVRNKPLSNIDNGNVSQVVTPPATTDAVIPTGALQNNTARFGKRTVYKCGGRRK